MKKILGMVLGLLFLTGCGVSSKNTMELPEKEQVSGVELSMVPARARAVVREDSDFVEELLTDLAAAKLTGEKSVNDRPDGEGIVLIELVMEENLKGFFYQKDGICYFEIPYSGVWTVDRAVYDKYRLLAESEQEVVRTVFIDGRLFFDVNRPVINGPTCGVPDGIISSSVGEDEIPTEQNQSNFGVDYPWQYGGENVINIMLDEGWMAFEAGE